MKTQLNSWLIIPLLIALGSNPNKSFNNYFIEFDPVAKLMADPSVLGAAVTSEVFNGNNLNVSISTTQINLPNGSLNNGTVNENTVKLFNNATSIEFPNVNVNSTGGGDAITLTALGLDFNTTYRMEISNAVEDISGAMMTPFDFTFTTTIDEGNETSDVEFEKLTVATGNQYTCVTIGPDDKLYGLVNDGGIHRWDINLDGTLTNFQSITSLSNRLAIDITFDPSSTEGNLVAWVSHTSFGFSGQSDWEGKITRLSGPDLGTVQDYLINLPRSAKDHVTNGIDFGPDGALYFLQGSNSAMGAADQTWGFRPERLLTAAVMRVDVNAITNPPLDVKTEDGGTYDPFATGAPVTLFSTGIRNAYDLVWHSNGQLYVPTNGSAAGGNTPQTPGYPGAPSGVPQRIDGRTDGDLVPVTAINGVGQTQNDQLFRAVQGSYHGHPNPTRGEYVLNGGNPTSNTDPVQVNQYPVGTLPDPNWRGFAYNFVNNKSPNGVIEYQSNTFGGALKNKLLVVRYSGGDDIIVLTPGGTNLDIIDAQTGITGFTGLSNPLDLTENTSNGHIYISEYGASRIALLRPLGTANAPVLALNKEEVIFSGFVNPPGSLPDDVQTVAITNDGVDDLQVSSLNFSGANAADFTLLSPPGLPLTILTGQSVTLSIEFDPSQTGALQASLDIGSNDLNNPTTSLPLYGLGSQQFEGSNEAPMSDIIATLGYNINIGWTGLTSSITTFPLGDEILESTFQKVGSGPVVMTPVARYSPAFLLPFGYYEDNDDTTAPTLVEAGVLASGMGGSNDPNPEHQTLFPALNSGTGFFDPGSTVFGFFTTSPSHTAYTEDALNALLHPGQAAHAARIYALNDRAGDPVPNTYLVGFEEASNGDYQDYVFIISNIIPASQSQNAPVVNITSPANNTAVVEGNAVNFTATANDTEDGDLSAALSWESSIDGTLGSGAAISATLTVGTHTITATATDTDTQSGSDQITIVVNPVQAGDILYRETFWNEDASNDINLSIRGWNMYKNGGVDVSASKEVASKGIGKPTGLQNINAGDVDPTPADGRGLAAGFDGASQYFAFTEELSIDLANTTISQISWYLGNSASGTQNRVAVRIGSQWYVSTTTLTMTGIGSATNFPNATGGAELKTFPFSTAAASWATLDFAVGSTLAVGATASADLSGNITAFGLYSQNSGGFTFRFDTYQINGESSGGGNNSPVVANLIPDQVATVDEAFSFQFASDAFNDPDPGDVLTYSAVEQGQAGLPNWLSFDDATRTFTGTPPTANVVYPIEVRAMDNSNAFVTDVFDIGVITNLETCSPISTEDCSTIPVNVSAGYCLEFDAAAGGFVDNNGTGTGFTMVSAPSANIDPVMPSNPAVPGYEPGKLDISGGNLTITATKGIFFKTGNGGNSQVNGLGVGFNADLGQAYDITTKLVDLPAVAGGTNFQQAGLWFGLNEANYVKLVVIVNSVNGYELQLSHEVADDVTGPNQQDVVGDVIPIGGDVVLKMTIDPAANTVTGFYSLDDGNSFTPIGASITLTTNMILGQLLSDGSTGPITFAGLHASSRNAAASAMMDFSFDYFCINEQTSPATSLTINAALQGRSDYSGNYEVGLYPSGQTTPVYSNTEMVGATGEMTLTGLTPGTYVLAVKHVQYLRVVETVTINAGSNIVDVGSLLAGDGNNDNQVSAIDFSILAGTYNLQEGDAGYNPNADYNGNTLVNALDFSLLVTNFNVQGEQAPNEQ
ncbi:putative Ig domain-containing protein [Neolewinella persica]|uniref:putative Ig domain-containing protein n=1 Tax=Neolewinella persica TaxID=70998 RepID=UPI00035F5A61|nr:putative Ig domain-containing protein [Neolewinella persica]